VPPEEGRAAGWWLVATSLALVGEGDEQPEERPVTWENEVVGEAKELAGLVVGDKELTEEGQEQAEAAHEVREEYRAKHSHEKHQG
jgi:uncharacterized protein YjbJ (UPF0337 family)